MNNKEVNIDFLKHMRHISNGVHIIEKECALKYFLKINNISTLNLHFSTERKHVLKKIIPYTSYFVNFEPRVATSLYCFVSSKSFNAYKVLLKYRAVVIGLSFISFNEICMTYFALTCRWRYKSLIEDTCTIHLYYLTLKYVKMYILVTNIYWFVV